MRERRIRQRVDEKTVDGRAWHRYQTSLGKFWIAAPEKKLLEWLLWKMVVQGDYDGRLVAVRPGDVVIDCGAHIVCTYHLPDDPEVNPQVVRKAQSGYRIYGKDIAADSGMIRPKVLFFL